MTFEYRPIADDEVRSFRTALSIGFGNDAKPDDDERFRKLMPLERTVAAFDGDSIVGTLGDFPLQLTVPGGNQIAMAGTTMVTVSATHTRRGILRSMIRHHLDNAVANAEPVAGLWASEPGIYGRFGFGLASENHDIKVDARHLTCPAIADDLDLTLIPASAIPEVVAPFWTEIAGARSGFIERSAERWEDIIDDPESHRGGLSAARHVVARRNGTVVGYVEYRQQNKWEEFVSNGSVSVGTLVAADHQAHVALWAHVLDIDLFPNVEFWNGAVDDEVDSVVRESRAIRKVVVDALYVRILDIATALTARRYESEGSVVMQIVDDMGYVDGTYLLDVRDGQATVEPTRESASVVLGARELGALYLGRTCCDLYARTGHITGSDKSVRMLGQLFASARQPWCPEMF